VILLIGHYRDPDSRRRAELAECLRRNAAHRGLEQIRVFLEEPLDAAALVAEHPALGAPKVRLLAHGRRLTYRALFAHAAAELAGKRVIIANADIYFDTTLGRLASFDFGNRLLCLSRWDVAADGALRLFDHPHSQDAWIFQSPLRDFSCDFPLGVPGCDNRLAWEARNAGIEVLNPARSVRACHLHASGVRRYSERQRLHGPTLAMAPGHLAPAGPAPQLPCAPVAFREAMGYRIARLQPGVSSHSNDERPFTRIPEPIAGRSFTQVVACHAAPVEVEFLAPGKLYVLVGTDWEGYHPATAWLRGAGYREDMPLAETRRGTAFEVWSLAGDGGEQFVIPTQVMLVSDRLERR
jgi:hypothetical protein